FRQEHLGRLQQLFAPYVLRRLKDDCLDLPEKNYEKREVALSKDTWRIYCELKREAMLMLSESADEAKPEPNAAVRLLRLCQITSGHVGKTAIDDEENLENPHVTDLSSEKLDYITEEILTGELSSEQAVIVWCRWRRERERLAKMLIGNIMTL